MESFSSSVRREAADRVDSRGEANMESLDSIEVFYNQRRRQSTLDQISPAAFERQATYAAWLNRPRDRINATGARGAQMHRAPRRC